MEKNKKDFFSEMITLHGQLLRLDSTIAEETGIPFDEVRDFIHRHDDYFTAEEKIEVSVEDLERMCKNGIIQIPDLAQGPHWGFTPMGAIVLIVMLRCSYSVHLIREISRIFLDVSQLRRCLTMLSESEGDSFQFRDKLMQQCNDLFNKILVGDSGFECKLRSVKFPNAGIHHTPFSAPESRFDPVTRKFWLTEEELTIIQKALDGEKQAHIPFTSPDVN